uniref:CCHC-type domain-containing protein n=1 Tax=Globodera rostochiensis TaxID=31243 RepID=A0A914H6H7_GLORO
MRINSLAEQCVPKIQQAALPPSSPQLQFVGNEAGNNGEESDPDPFADASQELGAINTLTGMIGQLEVFGEESVIAFDQWAERFSDYIGAVGRAWSDAEKIARLKMSLVGTPRQLYKQLTAAETATFETAIKGIRQKLDSPQRRELTKRTLALCKQRENETVSEFLKRLAPLVEMVNPSLNDGQRKEKVCEEFLDRVKPNIGFLIRLVGLNSAKDLDRVKAQAEELEALLMAEKGQGTENLTNTVQALTGLRIPPQTQARSSMAQSSYVRPSNVSGANSTPLSDQNRQFYGGNNQSNRYRMSNNQRPNNQQMQSQRRWNSRPICNFCGKIGHLANFCRSRQCQFNNSSNRGYRNQNGTYRNGRDNNTPTINAIQQQPSNVTILDSDQLVRAIANLGILNPQPSGSSVKNENPRSVNTISTVNTQERTETVPEPQKGSNPVTIKLTKPTPAKTSSWEGIGPKITKFLMIAFVLTLIKSCPVSALPQGIPIPKNPIMCQTQVGGTIWSLPQFFQCSSPQLNQPQASCKQSIWLYKPNAFQFETEAWACRKIRKSIQKHTSLTNVPVMEKLDPEPLDVELGECRQMIAHRKCSFGTLSSENELSHTDNKLDLSPRLWFIGSFNWARVSSENCYLFKTKIVTEFGSQNIQNSLGDSDHCPFEKGECRLDDKTLIVWNSSTPKNCEFLSLGPFKGRMLGNTWIADKEPLLLTFDNLPKTVKSCGTNLTLSHQGYAIFNETTKKRRGKREEESMVTDSQLQSELSYLSWQVEEALRFSFLHAFQSLCEHVYELRRWAISAALSEPTMLARTLFNSSLIHAKNAGPGVIKIWPCVEMKKEDFNFVPLGENSQENNACFENLPIEFKTSGSTQSAFIVSKTMQIVAHSRKAPCPEYRRQIITIDGELLYVDQVTAKIEKAVPNILNARNFEYYAIPPVTHHTFHHLLLNNASDFFTHLHISNQIRLSQLSYKIRKQDGEILVTPSEQWEAARGEVFNFLMGDCLLPPIHSKVTASVNMLRIISGQREDEDMPFVPCKIDGEEIWALVDTGSNVSVIPFSVLARMSASGKPVQVDWSKSDLFGEELEALKSLVDEFSDIFSKMQYDLGSFTEGAHHFTTTTEAPVSSPPRRMPYKYRDELKNHIEKLLAAGVMIESETPWVTPFVVVQKKDGTTGGEKNRKQPETAGSSEEDQDEIAENGRESVENPTKNSAATRLGLRDRSKISKPARFQD